MNEIKQIEFNDKDYDIVKNIEHWFIVNNIRIQTADYIEHGPYIEKYSDGMYCLWEIPLYGGDPGYIGEYKTIIEAIEASRKLT